MSELANIAADQTIEETECVIIGTGFGGLYAIHKLHALGFKVAAFESAPDVGGVWYWNNYPGARCDHESLAYSYSFSEELQQEWKWPEKYSAQPDILRYARHVADRFDLRRHIRFETKIIAATWQEVHRRWVFETDRGTRIAARFFISAVGCLSAARVPDFPGLAEFSGKWYHTGQWPVEKVDFAGQHVGVIGTGSSAIQAIPVIAEDAAQLTVFQRTPNYSVPARNGPLDPVHERHIKENYAHYRHIYKTLGRSFTPPNENTTFDVTPEARAAEYAKRWDAGGPLYMAAFKDMMVNRAANDLAADFLREKIRTIVNDPVTADLLSPKNYPIGAKRICVDTNYYATFNKASVSLVDVKRDPVARITPDGVDLESGRHFVLDTLVFATGYDAMTGALLRIDITGRNGQSLRDKWAAGPRAYLGLATEGFPNMFIITGPGSPSVISNVIMSIEQHVEWLADALVTLRDQNIATMEADAGYEQSWVEHVNEVANRTLFPQAESWYLGANIPGKPRVFMPYVGGMGTYLQECEAVAKNGYDGFILEKSTGQIRTA
jgi:cyclohexanone monooxygenase